jgi:hypothetical protein
MRRTPAGRAIEHVWKLSRVQCDRSAYRFQSKGAKASDKDPLFGSRQLMKNRQIAAIAAVAMLAIGLTAMAPRTALADQDNHNGTNQQQHNNNGSWSNNGNGSWSNGRWYPNNGNGSNYTPSRGRNQDDRGQGARYNGTPSYNGQPYYAPAPYYNGPSNNGPYYNAPYNNGPYNNGGNNYGGYAQGNAALQGVIMAVSGDQLTVRDDSGRAVVVNDQPALANQASGRVYVGRSIHAMGYWQNSVFYATQMN